MNLTFFVGLFVFNFLNVHCTDKVLFLKDFFTKLRRPNNVLVAHLCWNRDNYSKLQQILKETDLRHVLTTTDQVHQHLNKFNRIFLTDMDCQFFYSLIKNAYKKELYKFPNKWIIFGNLTSLKRRNYYFPINSFLVVIEKAERTDALKIQALYKLNKDSQYYENIIGLWSRKKGFLFYNELTIIKNRTNFFRMPLRVSYVMLDNSSLEHMADNRYRHIDKPTKINYLMYEHLVDIWNMTHERILRRDWGLEFHPEKTYYKGMLGDLNYGRADVAGTIAFARSERVKYFNYLLSTIKGLSVNFIFRAPPLPYSTNLYALPFDRNVWIGCGIILSLCCLVLWIIIRWELNEPTLEEDRELHEENAPNFVDIVMMQIAVVCQMDYFYEPRSTSGKIATFTLLLGFSYIYTAFSARIVILLQSTANNLHDVSALYDAKMDMGVEDTPYNKYYFSTPEKRTNEKMRTLIYYNKIIPKGKNPNYFTVAEGLKLVQTSYFAFHAELTTATNIIEDTFTNEEKCSVRIVDSIYKADNPHICGPKNSTFTEYILIGFLRLFETGVHSRENRKKFAKLSKCTGQSTIFVSVGLIESYFAFEMFISGVLLSLFILVLELISDIYNKHSKKNKRLHVRSFV